jgi:phage shock protein E
MIEFIKKLFGLGPQTDYAALVKNGAPIIDVRTKGEFQGGHIKGSQNIPLDTLKAHMAKLDKNKPVIVCCASGMRSGSAKGILKANGFVEVHNGGSWMSLNGKIS